MTADDRDALLAAVDLGGLWGELVGPRGRGGGWPCPNRDHAQTGASPPVSIDQARQLWCCHGCGAAGSAVDLLRLARGLDVADAFAELRRRTGMVDRGAQLEPRHRPRRVAPVLDPSAGVVTGRRADDAMAVFLAGRRWRREVVDAWDLAVVEDRAGRLRVRHPYRSGGRTRWYQDRVVNPAVSPKWLSPAGTSRMPYAVDLADVLDRLPCPPGSAREVVLVVEGPADVIAVWHAAPHAAAIGLPGGSGVARWAPMLAGLDVLVAFDADDTGDRAAASLAAALPAHDGRSIRVRPPDGLDLDDWRRRVGDAGLTEAIVAAADRVPWTPDGGQPMGMAA